MTNALKELPFDQYSRQVIVRELLECLRPASTKYKLLDIGGYKGNTSKFLHEDNVTVVDLFESEEENYVKASGEKLPFADESFDYCLSFDALEHIESSKRIRVIDEALRVAKHGVIFCAPQATPLNSEAEESLNAYYKKIHGSEHRWLKEHIEYALPDFEKIVKHYQSYEPQVFYSNDIFSWSLLQGMFFLNEANNWGASSLVEINKHVNNGLGVMSGKTPETSYRAIICILKDKASRKKLSKFKTKVVTDEILLELLHKAQDYYSELVINTQSHFKAETELKNAEIELYKTRAIAAEKNLERLKSTKAWKAYQKTKQITHLGRKN